MKTLTFCATLFLSVVGCKGSTQNQGGSAPPPASSELTSGAASVGETADGGAADAPGMALTRSPTEDAAVAIDAPPAVATHPLVGVRALTFRAGAHPPVGVSGAHGATVWAITLAASAGPSPELTALFQQTQAAHLAASVGEMTCTPAVGESYPSTIPTGDGAQVLSVTFRSERDARQFAAALTETPLRIGRVRVLCAD